MSGLELTENTEGTEESTDGAGIPYQIDCLVKVCPSSGGYLFRAHRKHRKHRRRHRREHR